MDFSSILPLLLAKNADVAPLVAALSAAKNQPSAPARADSPQPEPTAANAQPSDSAQAALISALAGKTQPSDSAQAALISAIAAGGKTSPETATALASLMKADRVDRRRRGFEPIMPFVCNDVLGKMDKYMSKFK